MKITEQAVTGALLASGFLFYKKPRRGPVVEGIRVRQGRGVVFVHTDLCADGTAAEVARRVATSLNGRGFAASFDPDYGATTGVVFVRAP